MLVAAVAILAGTAMPWAVVVGESLWGSPTAIAWTLWAGVIVLAGALVRWRRLVALSAAAGGTTAIVFAVWQTGRIVDRCLSLDCLPGPGLGLLLAGGVAALLRAAPLVFTGRH